MGAAYTTILTPVDFSISTKVAIEKSMEVSNCEGAIIHLLHVLPVSSKSNKELVQRKKLDLQQLVETLGTEDHIDVQTHVDFSDDVQAAIAARANSYNADLVVIGKQSTHWLPFFNTVSPGSLAEECERPVLTVKPGAVNAKMKTVVVPVGDRVPYEKMNAIAALCHSLKLKVHLITFLNGDHDATDYSASSLLHVYQWLKKTINCHIEYAVLHGTNRMKSLLNYSNGVDADLVLLYPGAEASTGWLKRSLSDVLPANSKLQVLAVQPENY